MKPASLHRRILFPLLLCGGLLFALLFWYFSPFFSPGENRRFSAYVEERFHSEVTSSAITLHYTLADPASRGIAPGTASFGTVSIPDRTSYDALLQSVETTLTSFHRNRLSAENQITLDLLLCEQNGKLCLNPERRTERFRKKAGAARHFLAVQLVE